MTKTGPRDDAKVAAIKSVAWPRSDWNKWPPSLESAADRVAGHDMAAPGYAPIWLAALPDSLRDGATAEVLEPIVDLDLTELADIQFPRGYGRD